MKKIYLRYSMICKCYPSRKGTRSYTTTSRPWWILKVCGAMRTRTRLNTITTDSRIRIQTPTMSTNSSMCLKTGCSAWLAMESDRSWTSCTPWSSRGWSHSRTPLGPTAHLPSICGTVRLWTWSILCSRPENGYRTCPMKCKVHSSFKATPAPCPKILLKICLKLNVLMKTAVFV